MLPSERINQIDHEITYFDGNTNRKDTSLGARVKAIEKYLDEVYEAEEKARQELIKNIKPM